jgi:methionyl aminopeptidase
MPAYGAEGGLIAPHQNEEPLTMSYVETAPTMSRPARRIRLHDAAGFAGMRKAGRLAADCLDILVAECKVGVTTERLDTLAREYVFDHGGVPATLFYRGYKHSLCTSLNHVVCHGMPSAKELRDGDILNIDVTVVIDGWHGDTSRMYAVGETRRKAARLMEVTYECLMRGIAEVKPGARLGDVGAAIQSHAERNRYSVVRDFCGHGLGQVFHDAPEVLHYGQRGTGVELQPGMFFTIEPMINVGRKEVSVLPDGWTAITRDRSLSAQFEHSCGVTETGVEIFTLSATGMDEPYKQAGPAIRD